MSNGTVVQNVITPTVFYPRQSPALTIRLAVIESDYYLAIALAFVGFFVLAFALLFPVYRFIKREEQRSEAWTEHAIAERRRQALEKAELAGSEGDGSGGPGESPELKA